MNTNSCFISKNLSLHDACKSVQYYMLVFAVSDHFDMCYIGMLNMLEEDTSNHVFYYLQLLEIPCLSVKKCIYA